MLPLVLINGHFMRGGVEVMPEIGNREQIMLLQRYEKNLERIERAAKKGTLAVDITREAEHMVELSTECICGGLASTIQSVLTLTYDEMHHEGMLLDAVQHSILTCEGCGRQYIIEGGFAKLYDDK